MQITLSKLAMYEGLIALAWVDGPIHAENHKRLFNMFHSDSLLSEDQRQKLLDMLNQPVRLDDVWPRITDPQDRAYLLDYAPTIFLKDGNYSPEERALHAEFMAKHLTTLDGKEMRSELEAYAGELKEKRKKEECADSICTGFMMGLFFGPVARLVMHTLMGPTRWRRFSDFIARKITAFHYK
jgi:hypothetical protein